MGLKDVLSHGSRKGVQGEGSHLQQAHQSDALPIVGQQKEFHPIYDEFTGQRAPGTAPVADGPSSSKTSGNVPHFSNTANLNSDDSTKHLSQSPKQDDSTTSSLRPGNTIDEASTVSIKSGIAGLPQGKTHHVPHSASDQSHAPGRLPPTGAQQMHSTFAEHVNQAATEPKLHHQKDYNDLRYPESSKTRGADQPIKRPSLPPLIGPETGRYFPMAGGGESRHESEALPIRDETQTSGGKFHEDLSGSEHVESNPSRGHGREGLAGAAAAFAATAAASSLGQPHHTHGEGDVATAYSQNQIQRDALAGATTAFSRSSVNSTVDPCVTEGSTGSAPFTSGPHRTDTANRLDQNLHIPGEFPETPMETPGEHQGPGASYLPGTGLEKTGTTDHDRARDVAAVGAASLGAYGLSQHHQGEPAASQGETMAIPPNPYTSQRMDPRVDSKPAGSHAPSTAPVTASEHHSDDVQQTSRSQVEQPHENHHYARNMGLAGTGAVAAGGLYYANRQEDMGQPVRGEAAANASHRETGAGTALDENLPPAATSTDLYTSPQSEPRIGGVGSTHTGKSDVDQIVDKYVEHPSTRSRSALDDQRYDPSAPGAHDPSHPHHHGTDAALAAGAGGVAYGASGAGHDENRTGHPAQQQSNNVPPSHGQAIAQVRSQQFGLTEDSEHHHGRNAAVGAAGVGAAGTGPYAASSKTGRGIEQTAPSGQYDQSTTQPQIPQQALQQQTQQPLHQQSRQQPLQQLSLQQQPHYQHDIHQQTQQPQQDDWNRESNHHGRNAALGAAGAGVASAGLYAASRPDDDHQNMDSYTERDHTGMQQQPLQQSAQQPLRQQPYHDEGQRSSDHHGRNAALGAAGVGVTGAGLYAALRSSDESNNMQNVAHPQGDQTAAHQRYDSVQYPNDQYRQDAAKQEQQHHDSRNAALARGAAVGVAGAGAGYTYAQQQREMEAQAQTEKERLAREKAEQKELEHQRKEEAKAAEKKQKAEQRAHEKELEHEKKEAEKKQKAEQKAHEKEVEHQRKEEHKALIAQQNAQEKEQEREQREHDKLLAVEERERAEAERAAASEQQQQEQGKGKKHHLFGFLHKDKKDKTTSPEQSPRASKEYAAAAQDGSASPTGSIDRHRVAQGPDGRNKLHKDPPKGHPAWQVMGEPKRNDEDDDDVRHPMQVARDETLHSGVYEAPRNPNQDHIGTETQVTRGDVQVPGNGSEARGIEGYRQLTRY